ncbi:MAG: hypothetical protein WA971_01005 [Microbacterium sp.]
MTQQKDHGRDGVRRLVRGPAWDIRVIAASIDMPPACTGIFAAPTDEAPAQTSPSAAPEADPDEG